MRSKLFVILAIVSLGMTAALIKTYSAGQMSACRKVFTHVYDRLELGNIDQKSLTEACEGMFNDTQGN